MSTYETADRAYGITELGVARQRAMDSIREKLVDFSDPITEEQLSIIVDTVLEELNKADLFIPSAGSLARVEQADV